MKKAILIILLVAVLVIPAGLASGQENGGKYQVVLSDGTAILIPDEWEFVEDAGTYLFSSGDDRYLAIYPPAVTAGYGETFETPTDLLVYMHTDMLQSTIDETAIEPREDGVEYPFADEKHEGVSAVVEWGDGWLFYLSYAAVDEYDVIAPVVESILAQLPKGAAAAAQCFVSTDKSYGVPLRLGPGLNRGEITSLTPKDGEVAVLGKATASDGSLWWRVDKTIPDAKELWVADTDVIKTGDCDRVGETAAQGIIAPAPGFVPAQPTPSSPEAGQTGAEAGVPPADANLVPRSGTWNVQYSGTLNLSCQGTGNVTRPSAPVLTAFDLSNGNVTLSSPDGGATLLWQEANGYMMFNQNAPGLYTAQATVSDPNWYGVVWLHVTGPTSVWGEVTYGIQNPPCSGTISFSFTLVG